MVSNLVKVGYYYYYYCCYYYLVSYTGEAEEREPRSEGTRGIKEAGEERVGSGISKACLGK